MRKVILLAVVLAIAAIVGWRIWQKKIEERGMGGKSGGAAPVLVATVVQKSMPIEVRTFGTVEANATVSVKPQIQGVLSGVHFKEGQDVVKGDLLFTVDPLVFESALNQAAAILARDTVQLRNAEKEENRQKELFKKGIVAEEAVDQAMTTVAALSATVRADAAAATNASLQLGYCFIHAPIDGRTGQRMVDSGNVVKPNETALVTINRIKPIDMVFTVPQQQLAVIREFSGKGVLNVEATIPEGSGSVTGTLSFIDNAVNPATGTVLMKGSFPNDDGRLLPGQFVNVVLTLGVQAAAIVIPSAAIQAGQKGDGVFVVYPDMSVSNRIVIVERVLNDDAVIGKGLAAGEQVVVDGQLQLRPGSKVSIKNLAGK